MTEVKPIQEIRKIGFQALVQALGPVDAARYMRICETGVGDYTKERRVLLDTDLQNVVSDILKARQK